MRTLARKTNVVPVGKIFSLPCNKNIKAIRAYNLQIIAENKREKASKRAYDEFFTAYDIAHVIPCKVSWKKLIKAYREMLPYTRSINTYYGYIKRYTEKLNLQDSIEFLSLCKKYDLSIEVK